MFNFKSLLLTIVAALGLAASVQVYPKNLGPFISDRFDPITKEKIEYLRAHSQEIAQELIQALDKDEAFQIIEDQIILWKDFLNKINEKQIAANFTCKTEDEAKLLLDESQKLFIKIRQESTTSLSTIIEILFPAKSAPFCSSVFHDILGKFIQQIPGPASLKLPSPFSSLESVTFFKEKTLPAIADLTIKTLHFHKTHTDILKEVIRSFATLITDDAFFNEVYKQMSLAHPLQNGAYVEFLEDLAEALEARGGVCLCCLPKDTYLGFIGVLGQTLETSSLSSVKNLKKVAYVYTSTLTQTIKKELQTLKEFERQEREIYDRNLSNPPFNNFEKWNHSKQQVNSQS